jgi:hypothetical protein
MDRPRPLHWIVLIALVATWGSAFAALKTAVGELPPVWVGRRAALGRGDHAGRCDGDLARAAAADPPAALNASWLWYAAWG